MRLKKERRTPPRKARWRCTEHATRPGSCDVRTACPLATSWKETSKGLSAVGSVREPLLQRAGVPQRVRRELCVELALGGKAEVHVDFRSIHARSSDAVVSVCLCARVYPECVCCLGASFTCVQIFMSARLTVLGGGGARPTGRYIDLLGLQSFTPARPCCQAVKMARALASPALLLSAHLGPCTGACGSCARPHVGLSCSVLAWA